MAVAVGRRWETLALGNLAEFRNGINYNKDNFGRGIKVINVKDFQDYSIASFENLDQVNLSGVIKEKDLLKAGDIIFVRSNGNRELIGRSLFIKDIRESVTHSAFTIKLRFTSNQVIPRFYAYLFRSSLMRQTFSAQGNGTNISNLNQGILSNLEVPLPPLPIQRKIAAILSAYDDLIENNTRRIEILEEMARSIYREWFLKFRFPGHEQVQMVDSELGPIPEGWEVKKLGEVIRFKNGKSLKVEEEGDYLVYGSNGIVGRTNEARYQNAIIIGRVGAYCGSLIYSKSAFNASDNTIIAESASEKFSIELAFYVLEQMNLRHYAGGAAQPLLTQTVIKEIPAIVPDIKTNKSFQIIIANIINFKSNLTNKIENLRKTRDLLLPRLISGEIDVENLDINTGPIAA